MTDWYAPNQQAVRPDGSGPAEEGNGGSTPTPEKGKQDTGSEGKTAPSKPSEKSGRRKPSPE